LSRMINFLDTGSDTDRLLRIAELYYVQGLKQDEIASRLRISRPWVSRLLGRAQELGLVRVQVQSPSAGVPELEAELVSRFGLRRAMVTHEGGSNTLPHVARAVTNYLISILSAGQVLAVTWGRTLHAVAQDFPSAHISGLTVVPLVGGVGNQQPELHSNSICRQIATAVGGRAYMLNAPALTMGPEQRDVLLQDPQIRSILDIQSRADVAVVGLGALQTSTLRGQGYLSDDEVQRLAATDAVGDIALRFINAKGNLVDCAVHERLVGIDLRTLRRNAKCIVGVAVGKQKIPVLRAALMGRWLDALATDRETASELLGARDEARGAVL